MKKWLFLLLLCAPALPLAASVRGYWTGYITQQGLFAIATNYQYSLVLETEGNTVYGYSEIRLWNDSSIYGRMAFSGSLEGNILRIVETEILEERIYSAAYWCLKELILEYSLEEGREYLRGHWNSTRCTGPGRVELQRPVMV